MEEVEGGWAAAPTHAGHLLPARKCSDSRLCSCGRDDEAVAIHPAVPYDPTTRKRERPGRCPSRPPASHRPPTRLLLNLNSKRVNLFHQQVDHMGRDAQLIFGDLAQNSGSTFIFVLSSFRTLHPA